MTPKERLEEQLKKLRLDSDLIYMIDDGIRKMSDEEALELSALLGLAIERQRGITAILKKIARPRPEYIPPPNPNFIFYE